MADLTVDYVPIDDVAGDDRNPKSHDVGLIASSIRRFGFADPLVVDERTSKLVAGHGRLSALRKIAAEDGHVPPDGVRVDDDGRWLAPVVHGWASSDDDEAAAALVVLNRASEKGGWNTDDLATLLRDLTDAGQDVAAVGYDNEELDDLLDSLAGPDRTPDPDRSTALAAVQTTDLDPDPDEQLSGGDVVELGPHVLIVASPVTGWETWVPYLNDDRPNLYLYPDVYLTCADSPPGVLVQPDPWIASLTVAHHKAFHGDT